MTDTITESWINMKKDTTNYGTSTITPAKTVDAWLGCKGGRPQIVTWGRQMATALYIKAFNGSKLKPKNQQNYYQFNMVVTRMKPLTSEEVNVYATNFHLSHIIFTFFIDFYSLRPGILSTTHVKVLNKIG